MRQTKDKTTFGHGLTLLQATVVQTKALQKELPSITDQSNLLLNGTRCLINKCSCDWEVLPLQRNKEVRRKHFFQKRSLETT